MQPLCTTFVSNTLYILRRTHKGLLMRWLRSVRCEKQSYELGSQQNRPLSDRQKTAGADTCNTRMIPSHLVGLSATQSWSLAICDYQYYLRVLVLVWICTSHFAVGRVERFAAYLVLACLPALRSGWYLLCFFLCNCIDRIRRGQTDHKNHMANRDDVLRTNEVSSELQLHDTKHVSEPWVSGHLTWICR